MMKLRRRPLCPSNSTQSPVSKRLRPRKVSEEEENEENYSIVILSDDEDEEEEVPVVQQQKTRMVTRQMSLIMNKQLKVQIQPFVDHTEDSLK